jgi:hypothetical protein
MYASTVRFRELNRRVVVETPADCFGRRKVLEFVRDSRIYP